MCVCVCVCVCVSDARQMTLKPSLSTMMPRNGEATAEMMYTKLLMMLASLELRSYLSSRNTLKERDVHVHSL